VGGVTRAADRAAARREARARRAELRLFAASRAYAARLDRAAAHATVDPAPDPEPQLPSVVAALADLEAAALHFAEVVPASARGRRRRA